MKKLLVLVVAVFFSTAIVDANVVPNNSINTANAEMMAPVYWQGWAESQYFSLYITVYRSANLCDGYYAVATKRRHKPSGVDSSINVELIVKTKNGGYYVTYDGKDYDFQM